KGALWFAAAAALYLTIIPAVPGWLHAPAAAAPIAFVLADALGSLVHRAFHRIRPLWRVHQLHHSAARVDVAGALYQHPLDAVLQLALLAGAVAVLGLPREGAALAAYFALAAQLFVHANIRTPEWVGWIVQRPEAHSVHHERGLHAY